MRSAGDVVERLRRDSSVMRARPLRMGSIRPVALSFALASFALAGRSAHASSADEAKTIFNRRCTGCHTFGKGVKVGPDLKGVTERRERPWLLRFIRSSQGLIEAKDPIAVVLFDQFQRQKMPDWTDLSEAQITAVLDWIAVDGPNRKEPDERDAELATSSDIERARALFHGTTAFANGGAPCARCHSIRDDGTTIGGSLGPNLTATYLRYRDRALTLYLRKPCFPREPESSAASYLTPDEAFALKAYLRRASFPAGATVASPVTAHVPPPPASPPIEPQVTKGAPPSNPSTVRRTRKRGSR